MLIASVLIPLFVFYFAVEFGTMPHLTAGGLVAILRDVCVCVCVITLSDH